MPGAQRHKSGRGHRDNADSYFTKSENAGYGKKIGFAVTAEGKFFLPPTHPDVSKIFAVRAPQGASHRWVKEARKAAVGGADATGG